MKDTFICGFIVSALIFLITRLCMLYCLRTTKKEINKTKICEVTDPIYFKEYMEHTGFFINSKNCFAYSGAIKLAYQKNIRDCSVEEIKAVKLKMKQMEEEKIEKDVAIKTLIDVSNQDF